MSPGLIHGDTAVQSPESHVHWSTAELVVDQRSHKPSGTADGPMSGSTAFHWRATLTEGKIQATVLRLPDFYGPGVDKSFLLFNPLLREMVEMHYLLTNPVWMDDSALRELLGPIRKTPYSEGVQECLTAIRAKRKHARD